MAKKDAKELQEVRKINYTADLELQMQLFQLKLVMCVSFRLVTVTVTLTLTLTLTVIVTLLLTLTLHNPIISASSSQQAKLFWASYCYFNSIIIV